MWTLVSMMFAALSFYVLVTICAAYVSLGYLILLTLAFIILLWDNNIYYDRDEEGERIAVRKLKWKEFSLNLLWAVYPWLIATYVRGYWDIPFITRWVNAAKPFFVR